MKIKGQTVAEYILIMSVVVMAVISVGMILRSRGAFENFFNSAAGRITG